MCGFAAWFDPTGGPPEREWLTAAAGLLAHRGPDDAGFLAEPGLGLAFRRLSIVDLAGGHQPLANEDGTMWIVNNGEVYNHEELRRELEALGHRFRTRCDTEASCTPTSSGARAARAAARHVRPGHLGPEAPPPVRGAGPAGHQAPLLGTRRAGLVFASEAKALFAFPGVRRSVHLPGLVEHLTLRYAAAPATLFEGIEKLPPAHHLTVDAGGPVVRRSGTWTGSRSSRSATTRPSRRSSGA